MHRINHRLTIASLLALALVLNGCLGGPSPTPPTRYYVLNPVYSEENPNRPKPIAVLVEGVVLGVGPIKLSQTLDRPQIIIRTSKNEIRVADLSRWAAPLDENIVNVLTDNLSTLLATGSILKFPWKTAIPIDYQIVLEITRFDGRPGGNVNLRARWGILSQNASMVLAKDETILSEPTAGDTIAEMVSAQSRLMAMLSIEIAKEIKRLVESAPRQ